MLIVGHTARRGSTPAAKYWLKSFRSSDFKPKIIPERDWGNHVRAERHGKGKKRLFLSAHLDTVWPAGTVAKFPFRQDGGFAYGPGVGDMKSGIVQMIYALKVLYDLGRETPPVSVFMTGDEEVGSVKGRPYIEEEARRSEWVLVVESSIEPDLIIVNRWGVGAFYLTIRGKAAHVMDQKMAGVNACRELALKILALEGLSDPLSGIKVSVNLVKGGVSRQMTAPEAGADIDVRIRNMVQMESLERTVRQIAQTSFLPGIQVELRGGMTRPPMELNENTKIFLAMVKEVGRKMGMELRPGMKSGGSDGCFTAALGVATLDGIGPFCYDLYSDKERIEVNNLLSRTLLTAMIIEQLTEKAE